MAIKWHSHDRACILGRWTRSLTETESWTPLAGASAVSRTTTHTYDRLGRELTTTDPAARRCCQGRLGLGGR